MLEIVLTHPCTKFCKVEDLRKSYPLKYFFNSKLTSAKKCIHNYRAQSERIFLWSVDECKGTIFGQSVSENFLSTSKYVFVNIALFFFIFTIRFI